MSSLRRVVVTGMGVLSPVGNNLQDSWQNILAGKSGIGPVEHFDTEGYSTTFGGFIKDFDVTEFMSPKDARKMDIFIQYGVVTAEQAIRDSGLEITEELAPRCGVCIGSGIGGLTTIERNHLLMLEGGVRKISPFLIPSSITNMAAGNVSIRNNLRGPNLCVVTACTTGTHTIGLSAQQIQLGHAEVMVAGGAEKGSSALGLAGFVAVRALSTRNDDPQAASRPWDKDRDGFVLGDGAGVLVLEEYEHAKARGAKIYAELIGFGMSADAYHMTSPPQSGEGAALSMSNAIKNAGIDTSDIQYINAHGTSTPAGDVAETRAVKTVFGSGAKNVAISSTKSMIGHLLGAAGAVEAIFSIMALNDQIAPPTINLDNPDAECDLDYIPGTARKMDMKIALSNSFGFGGTNSSVIFKKI